MITSFQVSILINVMKFRRLMSGSGIGITMAPARHPYRQLQVWPSPGRVIFDRDEPGRRSHHVGYAPHRRHASGAVHAPEALQTLGKQGYDPLNAGPDEFATFMRNEIVRWTDVARASGMKS